MGANLIVGVNMSLCGNGTPRCITTLQNLLFNFFFEGTERITSKANIQLQRHKYV